MKTGLSWFASGAPDKKDPVGVFDGCTGRTPKGALGPLSVSVICNPCRNIKDQTRKTIQ